MRPPEDAVAASTMTGQSLPIASEETLRRYVRERALPTRAMSGVTDALLHLFASGNPGVRELRNRGLTLVDAVLPLKRWLTARALDS